MKALYHVRQNLNIRRPEKGPSSAIVLVTTTKTTTKKKTSAYYTKRFVNNHCVGIYGKDGGVKPGKKNTSKARTRHPFDLSGR